MLGSSGGPLVEAASPNPARNRPALVSLGLPVYNAADFLEQCLDSLVGQTHRNLEIVISDNASTDRTPQICARYADRDSRIRLVLGESNQGAAWNHNRVLGLAGGTYFKWCGADDMIAPTFVERCVERLEASPEAVLAFPLTVVIDEQGIPIRKTDSRLPLGSADVRVRFRSLLSSWQPIHNPFYGLIRHDALRQARRFGTFLAGDRSLLAELVLMGPFLQVEEFLMFRRHYAKHRERTADSEQTMLDPSKPPSSREFRMLREHAVSALTAHHDLRTRLQLLWDVGGWAMSQRKELAWEGRMIASRVLQRMGQFIIS